VQLFFCKRAFYPQLQYLYHIRVFTGCQEYALMMKNIGLFKTKFYILLITRAIF